MCHRARPPLEDGQSFEEGPGTEEEDFGGFSSGPPPAPENTFKPIVPDPTENFAPFPCVVAHADNAQFPEEKPNGVDSDWAADFGGFSSALPPADVSNGDEDDGFGDFRSNTFQDTTSKLSHTTDNGELSQPASSLQNGVTSVEHPDKTSRSLEPKNSVPSESLSSDDALCRAQTTVKSDSQDNTSQGSITDSGLSSDISPGPKQEDFAEFPPVSGKDRKANDTSDSNKNQTDADTLKSNSSDESSNQSEGVDGNCADSDPQPLNLRPLSFTGDDSDTFQDDDSGTFGQFSDFAKPGTYEDSESDTKLSDQFQGDSDSQRDDSEFEEFKKSADSESTTPSDCDKTRGAAGDESAVPSGEIAEEDSSDFQECLSAQAEDDGSKPANVTSPETGYEGASQPGGDASDNTVPYQSTDSTGEEASNSANAGILPNDCTKIPDDEDDFVDFKTSGEAGSVAAAEDGFASFKASDNDKAGDGGWAAFGSSEPDKDNDGEDDWAAFSDAKGTEAGPENGVATTLDGAEEEDEFGDFGDHTTNLTSSTTTTTTPVFKTPPKPMVSSNIQINDLNI